MSSPSAEAAGPDRTGERFGNYILTAHLGRGGMADVFRAQRQGVAGFARTVVIKRILSQFTNDPTFVSMFVNEAKIAAQLSHPNIAQVFDLGEHNGEFFMALEYVRGVDLLHILRTLAKRDVGERAMPPNVAAYIAREMLRGLGHAHQHAAPDGSPQPIVHRDVSPQNVMVAYDGQVKIVDFGIAKAMFSMREETRTGALKGKIAYMSPEQVSGDNPGPESDVFAVGVVLYEMLIGRRLFKGQNDFETINRVKSMPIPPPSRVANWVPRELDDVVLHALERDREKRYTRASQMARDLDTYLAGHTYSPEEMADWMEETFPPSARNEVPDGVFLSDPVSKSQPDSRAAFGTDSRASGTSPDTPRALQPVKDATRMAVILLAVGGVLLVVALAVLGTVLYLGRKNMPQISVKSGTDEPAAPVTVKPPQPPVVVTPPPTTVTPPPTTTTPPPTADADKKKHHHHSTKSHGIKAFDEDDKKPVVETFED